MTDITEVKGIGPATAVKLHNAGIRSAEALARAEIDHLVGIIGRTTARKIIKNAQDLLEELGVPEEKIEKIAEETTEVVEEPEEEKAPEEPEKVEGKPEETPVPEGDLTAIQGIGPKTQSDLIAAGYTSPEAIANASVSDLTKVQGVGKKTAENIIANAKALFEEEEELEEIDDEDLEDFDEDELEEIEEIEYEDLDEDDYQESVDTSEMYDEDGVRTEHVRSPTPQGIPTRKRRGVQIAKAADKIDLDALDAETAEEKSGWKVKSKELTEEEREARRLRQEMLRSAEKITREIPTPPEPVKALKTEKKDKADKPVKKERDKKIVQQQVKKTKEEKRVERYVDYYSNQELHPREKPARPKITGDDGTSKPRIELDRDTYLGRISSKRRSRRNINDRQVIVQLIDEFEPAMLLGQKVYFTYPDGTKMSGSISRRFGKKSSKKVLVQFKKGIRQDGLFQKLYKY